MHRLSLIHIYKAHVGNIAVCTGGTADIPVAEEAAQTAEFFGCHVERIYDVGVAGIHRLLAQRERIREANCCLLYTSYRLGYEQRTKAYAIGGIILIIAGIDVIIRYLIQ